MNAVELINNEKLSEARALLISDIKTDPENFETRSLLFKVYCFYEEWDKADNQLNILLKNKSEYQEQFEFFKMLIKTEKERCECHLNNICPPCLPKKPNYMSQFEEYRYKVKGKKNDEAVSILLNIDKERSIKLTYNGLNYNDLKNTDDLIPFFIEAFIHDKYVWIPFEYIKHIEIAKPETLLDLVWIYSNLILEGGMKITCKIPSRYINSGKHEDDLIKMGRKTDWISLNNKLYQGIGQQVFDIEKNQIRIFDLGDLTFS